MKTYRIFRIVYWLAGFMPSAVMYWLCSLAGSIVYYFVPHVRRAVRDNMSHVLPSSTEYQRRHISRQVIRNVYKNYYDLLRSPRLKVADLERQITKLTGVEYLEEAIGRGKGVVMLSAHLGNYVLAGHLGPIRGYKAASIAEDISPAQLYNFTNRMRGHFGLTLIKMGSTQMRTIYRLFREGGILILAGDRDVNDSGVKVPFFDAPADLPEGPVALSMRLGVPLIPCFTWRQRNNKSEFRIYPVIEMEKTGDYARDLSVNMRKVAKVLEEAILRAPDQWVVLQRVWDNTPPTPTPAPQEAEELVGVASSR
jgi:phosphatidylinositol dimannoside acyltransferase